MDVSRQRYLFRASEPWRTASSDRAVHRETTQIYCTLQRTFRVRAIEKKATGRIDIDPRTGSTFSDAKLKGLWLTAEQLTAVDDIIAWLPSLCLSVSKPKLIEAYPQLEPQFFLQTRSAKPPCAELNPESVLDSMALSRKPECRSCRLQGQPPVSCLRFRARLATSLRESAHSFLPLYLCLYSRPWAVFSETKTWPQTASRTQPEAPIGRSACAFTLSGFRMKLAKGPAQLHDGGSRPRVEKGDSV